ncbi:MAG TPA: homocysteine S-methyltransferase family protein [Chitinophagaceae bacterium]|jgi:S-methylmethionine-dependent homocysteine/selenocysteine methylase|nr:homocysteine S-methyltransferase family protein [Chitinophagaceae bacterium]
MDLQKATLPNESDRLFLTDGGLETTLVFLQGFELPCFAAFVLLKTEEGRTVLWDYYKSYLDIARTYRTGFILESPTWRANPDWLGRLDYPASALQEIHTQAVQLLADLKETYGTELPVLISGCIGPRGDGYKPGNTMSSEEAMMYHLQQVNAFRNTPVDFISAMTINYVEEAIGIVQAAGSAGLPVVLSFTVETNGRLATGMSLQEAIERVDESAATPPVYYMINCAHPTHFLPELTSGGPWVNRIRGIRANASCKSHAELDESTELDRGHPEGLGRENRELKSLLPHLNVFGGCCGTDREHVSEIARQLTGEEAVS